MLYRVESIRHLSGTDRLDGRYPLRIGRVFEFMEPPQYLRCMWLRWLQSADGTPYHGYFKTSLVQLIEQHGNTMIVTTVNSVYTFTEIGDDFI